MASNRLQHRTMALDPMVRLHIALLFLKKERRLVAAILVAALLSVAATLPLRTVSQGPFNGKELSDMSGLPLAPDGSSPLTTSGSTHAPTKADVRQR
ncbi:MAG: hypothetical protein ABR507_00325 [Actinomycetota bacterium]|nr:hypothetical protein [Actinomycetota bacterium]